MTRRLETIIRGIIMIKIIEQLLYERNDSKNLHGYLHLFLTKAYETISIISSTMPVRRLKYKEMKQLVPGHTTKRQL